MTCLRAIVDKVIYSDWYENINENMRDSSLGNTIEVSETSYLYSQIYGHFINRFLFRKWNLVLENVKMRLIYVYGIQNDRMEHTNATQKRING